MAEVTGQPTSSKATGNIITAKVKNLIDDDGKVLTEDVSEEFFQEIILIYTAVPSDTVMSIHPSSRKYIRKVILFSANGL